MQYQGMGLPLRIDPATLNMAQGLYARILIDVYLMKALLDRVLVKSSEVSFFVSIIYEQFPEVCIECDSVGYVYAQCKKNNLEMRTEVPKRKTQLQGGRQS